MSKFSRRDFAKLAAIGLPLAVSATRAGAQTAGPADSDLAFVGGVLSTEPQGLRSLMGEPGGAGGTSNSPWAKQMGLELFTVRDMLAKDQAGTLAKVAALGYKEVEPIGYGGLTAKQYRALLDQNGLTAPCTHATAVMGPNFEKTLADMQAVGHRYVVVAESSSRFAPANVFGPPSPEAEAERAKFMAEMKKHPRRAMSEFFKAATPDSTKRTVDMYNRAGAITKKYGMQVLVHNHAIEFQRFPGSDQCPYDIITAESDPELVALEMDIGWTCVAGENPLTWWNKYPGRFPVWHVKDFMGLNYLFPQPEMSERQRMGVAGHWMTPVGLGQINYGELFKHASTAGMKHFYVEQDTAANWGDSVAAAGVSYRNLLAMI